ncbi:hypothetical protein ACFY2H_40555 [Streptomyces griseofuscus]|uniref:hypothetical protein n=1 Tax=Streptomyces griseofuscus TaxID=146922 RepID=UPI0036840C34
MSDVGAVRLTAGRRHQGPLPDGLETVIDAASTLDDTVQQILSESGLHGIFPIDR